MNGETIIQESRRGEMYGTACSALQAGDVAESWYFVEVDNHVVCIDTAPKRPLPSAEDWREFKRLTEQWRKERGSTSSIKEMVGCQSYLRIVNFGPKAITMLLWELQRQPDFWFAALRAITNDNPVLPSMRGNIKAMATAWIQWGVQNRYIEAVNGHR